MAKQKGVFTDELGDIDDLLPASIPNPSADTPGLTPPTAPQAPSAPTPAGASQAPWSPPSARPSRVAAGETVASVPSAQVDPAIHDRLVKLTARERARNTTTARTFAQVVLDAVEKHQAELADFWSNPAEAPQGAGLFRRQKVATSPKRRRKHEKPPARIPLGGIDPVDLETLDQLAVQWNAGSRSALVEQALRLEFKMRATS